MAKAINQNDLIDIIHSRVEFMSQIIDVVVSSDISKLTDSDSQDKLMSMREALIKLDEVVIYIVREIRLLNTLLSDVPDITKSARMMSSNFVILNTLLSDVPDITKSARMMSSNFVILKNLIKDWINLMREISIKDIDDFQSKSSKFDEIFKNIHSIIERLQQSLNKMNKSNLAKLNKSITLLNAIVIGLTTFLSTIIIAGMLAPIAMGALFLIRKVILLSYVVIVTLYVFLFRPLTKLFKRFSVLLLRIALMILLINLFAPYIMKALLVILIFVVSLFLIFKIIMGLNNRKVLKKLNLTIKALIKKIIVPLTTLIIFVILTGVIAIGGIVALIIIGIFLLALYGIILLINKIIRLINKIKMSTLILSFIKLMIILANILIISIIVTGIALLASIAAKHFMSVLILIGMIAAIAVAAVGIGILAATLSTVIGVAIIGLGLIVVVIGLILVIAGMLWLLQQIKLNPDKIKVNVKAVIETAKMVIEMLFKSDADTEQDKEGESWFTSVIKKFAGGLMMIIQAILAITFLALTVVAILLIDLIAIELRILQAIDLDGPKIGENVKIVIDTANNVIEMLFKSDADTEQDKEGESWYASVIEFLGGSLGKIIQAILAIIFLVITFVAILLIDLIATELRILQAIDLDGPKISENVKIVIDTAKEVINSLFNTDPEKKEEEGADKPWYESVLDWFSESFGAIGAIIQAILAIIFLALTMVAIGLILLIGMALEKIANLDFKDETVKSKTASIISTALLVIGEVNKPVEKPGGKDEDGWLGGLLDCIMPDSLKAMIDALIALGKVALMFGVIGIVAKLAENLVTINNLPSMIGITDKVKIITQTANTIIKELQGDGWGFTDNVSVRRKINALEDVFEIFHDFTEDTSVSNSKQLTDNYIRFLDKINTVNLGKLKTTENLFKNIADFSESISGNFNALADALNEKIAPLLEKLESGVSKLNKDVNDNAQNQLTATVEGNPNASSSSIEKAANGDKEKAKDLEANKKSQNEKNNKQYESMQDIMDILLGQNGYKGVKTH